MASGTTIKQMIDVVTPAAGESVTEGTILEWHVKVGEFIKVDDTIVEISTDKVDVELPSPASGTVVEILAEEGDTVGVGQVIARLAADEGGTAQPAGQAAPAGDEDGVPPGSGEGSPQSSFPSDTPQATSTAGGSAPAAAGTMPSDGTRVSPVAARVASAEGVNLEGVSGSGPGGRILKSDVLGARGNGAKGTSNGASASRAGSAKRSRAGRRCWPSTWTSRVRSPPRRASGR